MPNILIRGVPDEVHRKLTAEAEKRGQSLQQFVAGELARLSERVSVEDLFARVEKHRGGRVGLAAATSDLRNSRR